MPFENSGNATLGLWGKQFPIRRLWSFNLRKGVGTMLRSMELVEYFCLYPITFHPEIETSRDLLAGIRGICLGLGDPKGGESCLSDFPQFVQSRFQENANELWFNYLVRVCEGKSLFEACGAIGGLINEWE